MYEPSFVVSIFNVTGVLHVPVPALRRRTNGLTKRDVKFEVFGSGAESEGRANSVRYYLHGHHFSTNIVKPNHTER